METGSDLDRGRRRTSAVAGGLAVVFLLLLAYGFLKLFAPPDYEVAVAPYSSYDSGPMQTELSVARVAETQARIEAFGSRFMGSRGGEDAYASLKAAYEAAGLEMIELVDTAPAPVTLVRRLTGADGHELEGVEVFPFFPNTFQPMVTPKEGVTGELVLATRDLWQKHRDLNGAIVVIDMADVFTGADWLRSAAAGAKAVLLTHRDGLEALPWTRPDVIAFCGGNNPVNFVRMAALPSILEHVGTRVTLTVQTAWKDTRHRTLVGRLRAKSAVSEALVIPVAYDSGSLLPDVSSNPQTALSVAMHLQMLRGMVNYSDTLRRDVFFVAAGGRMSASAGERTVLQFIGPLAERREVATIWQKELAENRSLGETVDRVHAVLADAGVFIDLQATESALATLSSGDREFLREQTRYTINTIALWKNADVVRLKTVFDREGGGSVQSESFHRFFEAQEVYNEVQSKAGDSVSQLMRPGSGGRDSFMNRYRLADSLRSRFLELKEFHRDRAALLENGIRVGEWFQGYRQLAVLDPRMVPASPELTDDMVPASPELKDDDESLTFLSGFIVAGRNDARFTDLLRDTEFRLPVESRPLLVLTGGQPGDHDARVRGTLGSCFVSASGSDLWSQFGYAGYMLANTGRKEVYDEHLSPFPVKSRGTPDSIQRSLALCSEIALTLAHGNAKFDLPKKIELKRADFTGRVYAAGVGRSIVPNYPVAGALVGVRLATAGRLVRPFGFSDVYGRYAFRITPVSPTFGDWAGFSPLAVRYGADGIIDYIKDIGAKGQRVYASESLSIASRSMGGRNVNLVLFRADPISVLDMINPQTLKAYSDVDAWRQRTLQPFESFYKWKDDFVTLFVPPNQRLFLIFNAASPENEALQVIRAFALGDTPANAPDTGNEIDGPGFLPAETPIVTDVPLHAARSMTALNAKRLTLQERSGMADELTLNFHRRSLDLLDSLREGGASLSDRLLKSRDALTYAILNHPVIRGNVIEAVIGIVWYIGLLVPFVIFSEKLVFGFSDIRKQLVAHLVIFLIVFGLLRLLHPAFHMIRSSLMILLGFIIFLISTLVTLMISGRFKENLDEIRQKQAKVKGADVNTAGVLGTAFMLGLNNMHRRKVRTGLTCATLVLLTFVMICFTSVQSNVVDRASATGRAPYQGFLVKNEDSIPIAVSETAALSSKYGHRFILNQRHAYVGVQKITQEKFNPDIRVSTIGDTSGEARRQRLFNSCLLFDSTEPLAGDIKLLTSRGWFTSEQQISTTAPVPIMLPASGADELNIRPEQVDAGGVFVLVNGVRCEVVGIFDADSLSSLRDLDGYGLLPFDIMALQTIRLIGANTVLAEQGSPVIGADQVLLSINGRFPSAVSIRDVTARPMSVAIEIPALPRRNVMGVELPGNSYREARETVNSYLEQSGRPSYYGLDRFSYYGRRMRERSMGGMIDMLIPLIIAALTVVNTMRGSVYERRDEIFVYNAVGIAPRYIFFMFFAEAFVFSVMGSVLGYILSQGTGKILTALDWTGGLNMNFTSLSTVYASLTIVGAVFLSTWFPARSAMEIAAPAEDAGWKLPAPDGNRLHFKLPFTFDRFDRIAVLGFFARYLDDNGEGSSGPFFAGPPELGISPEPDEHGRGGAVPQISATIWLKPFDLGVSQRMTIDLPTDPETGEFIAQITLARLSGTADAWNRLCHGFTGRVRRHFLHWRAVTPDLKESLYREAAAALRESEARHG
jgi:hypothetical protein